MANNISPENPFVNASNMHNFGSGAPNPLQTFWETTSNLLNQAQTNQAPADFYSSLTAAVTTLQQSFPQPLPVTLEENFKNALAVISTFANPQVTFLPSGASYAPPAVLLQGVIQQLASNTNDIECTNTPVTLIDQSTLLSNMNGTFTNIKAPFSYMSLSAYPQTGYAISNMLSPLLLSAGENLVNASPPFTEGDFINNPILFPIMQLASLQTGMSLDQNLYTPNSQGSTLQQDFWNVLQPLFNPSRLDPSTVFYEELNNIIQDINNPNYSLGYTSILESMQQSLINSSAANNPSTQFMSSILNNAISLFSDTQNNLIQIPSSFFPQIASIVAGYGITYLKDTLKGSLNNNSIQPISFPTAAVNASTICTTAYTSMTSGYTNLGGSLPDVNSIIKTLFQNMLLTNPPDFLSFLLNNFRPPPYNGPPPVTSPTYPNEPWSPVNNTWNNCLLGYLLTQYPVPSNPDAQTIENINSGILGLIMATTASHTGIQP